jgi:hypothetical protein
VPQTGQEEKRTCKRERLEETALFRAPRECSEWVTGHKANVVRKGKEIYREKLDRIT